MKTSSARVAGLGNTIFAEMTALAASTGAINLGQGFPDADGPNSVIEAAIEAMKTGANQYPPGWGIPALRAAIAAHQQRYYGIEIDPDSEVVITTGATEAIAAAVLGLVDPGDEVIVLEPYYDSYVAVLTMAGAVRRPVTLRAPDFRLPLDELRSAVTDRTTAILLNSPHNPTGTVLSHEELSAIAEVAVTHGLIVISDEVYEHLTYGVPHHPISTFPGMTERTVTISSSGKTFSLTGWKVGWATGPAPLVRAVYGAKQFLSFASGAPFQPAIAVALNTQDAYVSSLRDSLWQRRDQLCAGLSEIGFDVYVPAGTYFVSTDIRSLGFTDGVEFCRNLPRTAGVVAIPTQVFYDDVAAGRPIVRWAFCKRPEVLSAALDRLSALRTQT